MKVVLAALNAKYVHTNIALRYLKKYTNDMNYDCVIKEFSINDRLERVLEEVIKEAPDVVGLSCYIWNAEMAVKLAQLIKSVDNKIEIVYGGPEVSFECSEFLTNNCGEYIIEGEGEETYREFIEFKLGSKNIKDIKGIFYKQEDGSIGYNGRRKLINMDTLSFPYEDNESLQNKIIYYEASRGCPFNCKYCLSSTIEGVRFRNIDTVKKELKMLMDKGVSLVKFVDRTFNCNAKYSREIWKFVIEASTNTAFHFEISADLLKEEDLEILRKAPKGRIQFEIGVQSTNGEVIENIDRTMNLNKLTDIVKMLMKENNIKLHLDLIAGLPGENFNSFKNSFNEVYAMGGHEVQLGFLKLLKGSAIREEADGWGMKYMPYPPYEILRSADITYSELVVLKKVEEMVDKYHNSGRFNNILMYFLPKFQTPFDFFLEFARYFDKAGYFSRNISGVEYYNVFLGFNKEILNSEDEILKDLIKYDYLQYNKKNWIPNFLERKVSKDKEKELKEVMMLDNDLSTTKNIYVEGFDIDIAKAIKTGIYEIKKCYYIFVDQIAAMEAFYYED